MWRSCGRFGCQSARPSNQHGVANLEEQRPAARTLTTVLSAPTVAILEPVDRLAGIDAKLDRAEKLVDHVDGAWNAWNAERDPWQFGADVNQEKRRYIVMMRMLDPPPPVLALIASEVVHLVRSSLDHLACYLVESCDGQVTRSTAWPVLASRESWTEKVDQESGGPLSGASSTARAFVEGRQPYNRPGDVKDDPLFVLNELWNIDKHRLLNATPIYVKPPDWRSLFHVEPDVEPIEFRWLIHPDWAVRSESRIALFRFPEDQPLPTVIMDGKLPVQIAIGDGTGTEVRFDDTLRVIRSILNDARALLLP